MENLNDGDELHVCWDGDGGGRRFIAEFAIINNKDRKITLHPFLIYEGTYVRSNLEVTLGRLTRQFIELEGATILVDGKTLKITQFGVFDLCALNCIIGKQTIPQHILVLGQTAQLSILEHTVEKFTHLLHVEKI